MYLPCLLCRHRPSFNRYMVECECAQTMGTDYYPAVLIDTWWNVNVLNLTDVTNADKSFNRYMVECESYKDDFLYNTYIVLIDTWWNVNTL